MVPELEEAGSCRSEQRKRRGRLGTSVVPCSLPTADLPIPGPHTGLRCLSRMEGSFVCGGAFSTWLLLKNPFFRGGGFYTRFKVLQSKDLTL